MRSINAELFHPLRSMNLLCGILLSLAVSGLFIGCTQVPHPHNTDEKNFVETAKLPNNELVELENRLQAEPDNGELRYQLGLAYLAENERDKNPLYRAQAEKHLRHILDLMPRNPATLKLLYNIYYEDTVAGEDGAFAKAHNIFNQMTPANQMQVNAPSLATFLHHYLLQKDSGEDNPEPLYHALLAAINEQPAMDKGYIQLARMYREANYFPLALATLKLAEEEIHDSEDLYEALAVTYEASAESSGCSYEKNHYLKNAISYYQQVVPLTPENPAIHYSLSRLFLDQNQYQLALHESGILVELEPSAENMAFHAQNYSMLGFHPKAYELLAQAEAKGLVNSDPAHHEIYLNAGDWRKAALSFTDYLQTRKNIHVYDLAKAGIIGQQANVDFSSLIRQKEIGFRNEWEAAVYAYWTGKITRDQFRQNARNRCQRTEYFFYSGYRDFSEGDLSSARRQFSAVLEQDTYRFIERPLARYFLSTLNKSVSAK